MRGGRGHLLGVYSEDPVLNWIGPIGLALTFSAALVVDLVTEPRNRTLADLRDDGPRLTELSPGRGGVATIAAGPVSPGELRDVLERLTASWPAVVVRSDGIRWVGPTVPYRPVYPGLSPNGLDSPSVWQVGSGATPGPVRGVVMPTLRAGMTRAMLRGKLPGTCRWVKAWGRVWELPWA